MTDVGRTTKPSSFPFDTFNELKKRRSSIQEELGEEGGFSQIPYQEVRSSVYFFNTVHSFVYSRQTDLILKFLD